MGLKRRAVVKEMRRAVFQEQQMQRLQYRHHRQKGYSRRSIRRKNEKAIAACCASFSKHCALEAHNTGLRDQDEALRIRNEKTRAAPRRSSSSVLKKKRSSKKKKSCKRSNSM